MKITNKELDKKISDHISGVMDEIYNVLYERVQDFYSNAHRTGFLKGYDAAKKDLEKKDGENV